MNCCGSTTKVTIRQDVFVIFDQQWAIDRKRPDDIMFAEAAHGLTSFESASRVVPGVSSFIKTVLAAAMGLAPLIYRTYCMATEGEEKGNGLETVREFPAVLVSPEFWGNFTTCATDERFKDEHFLFVHVPSLVKLVTLSYMFIGSATTYVILTISQVAFNITLQVRRFLLLVLYISSPVASRRLLSRIYGGILKTIYCKVQDGRTRDTLKSEVSFVQDGKITKGFDTGVFWSANELARYEEPESGDKYQASESRDKWVQLYVADHELTQYIKHEELKSGKEVQEGDTDTTNAFEFCRILLSDQFRWRFGKNVEMLKFSTLDVGLFWMLRKKLKAFLLTQIMQIQQFMTALFGCACFIFFLGLLLFRYNMNLEAGMALGVLIVVLVILVAVFQSIININIVLNDDTIGSLLNWKDLFERADWYKRRTEDQEEGEVFTHRYFQDLKYECTHVIEQIEKSEAPLSFLGIPITKTLRNTIILTLAGIAVESIPTKWKEFAVNQAEMLFHLHDNATHADAPLNASLNAHVDDVLTLLNASLNALLNASLNASFS